MSQIRPLHPEDQEHLFKLHDTFDKSTSLLTCSTIAATFLVIGALIVIYSTSLFLTLPGVNVMYHVILPGTLPGCGALALSIPFIVYSVKKSREKNVKRREVIDWSIRFLEHYHVEMMEVKSAATFIEENLFKPRTGKEYSTKVLSEIVECFPKSENDQSNEEKALIKALNKAKENIMKEKRSDRH